MKIVVITGSTGGIGYGLADSFLTLGCSVVISSRYQERVDKAASTLSEKHEASRVFTFLCDVVDCHQVQALWNAVKSHFGQVDIWINNAGMAHPETKFLDFSPDKIKEVINTNIVGAINGSMVALKGMLKQGYGAIYNMEGLGSDGRVINGMALYGATKSALSYLTRAIAKETRGTGVIVGGLRPGMVNTRLITEQYDGHPEEWERVKGIFNILSDRVETVTPWLAKKMLDNRKNGVTISWLTRRKLAWRFLTAPFYKRHIYD
jgi:short-subunit dehydrogenase